MVGAIRNPTRRNKNIGTAAQGFKHRNAFGIPSPDNGARRFYESLRNPVEIPMALSRHKFTVLVEPPLPGFTYYVSIGDVLEVLKLLPEADRKDIELIVFRQPKRKERIFSPVWGRMAYWAEIGKHSGVTVVIEAQPLDYSYRLAKSLGPLFARELDLLREDGHNVVTGRKSIEITCPPEAIRNTQLFRTLPHEIGHHRDFEEKVTQPEREGGDWMTLRDLYFARPQREREEYANRYAFDAMAPFRQQGIAPFPPVPDAAGSKVNPDWFYFATPSR